MFFFTFAIRHHGISVNEWHEFNRAIHQLGVFMPFAASDDAWRRKGKAKATGAGIPSEMMSRFFSASPAEFVDEDGV